MKKQVLKYILFFIAINTGLISFAQESETIKPDSLKKYKPIEFPTNYKAKAWDRFQYVWVEQKGVWDGKKLVYV